MLTHEGVGGRALAMIVSLVFVAGCAGIDTGTLGGVIRVGQGVSLDAQTVAAGIKEALRVGTDRTVTTTSKIDGFLGNALIRIALPEQFDTVAKTLRSVGLGKQVDDLEVAMNRAAERAAGEAREVFWNAVSQITIEDAFGILNGADDAATKYFRSHTEASLHERFKPIVEEKMSEVGLYKIYNELTDYYNKLPLVTTPALDLDEYVTEHALDGLFTVLGQEEKRIREDPLARTTELLRRVFGSR
jgi:hypothetical protein